MTSPGSVGGDDRLRLFLALRLPNDVVQVLSAWAQRTLRGGRILPAEDLHVTLAFLGSRPAAELPAIVAALGAAVDSAVPPELAVGRWRETRSVGMLTLTDATGAAASLAADLHRRLEAMGAYRAESRRWTAHVTVLRFRQRPRLQPPLPGVRTFVPSDAAAYLSRLHPSGARYEVLGSVPLDRKHNEDTVGRSEV